MVVEVIKVTEYFRFISIEGEIVLFPLLSIYSLPMKNILLFVLVVLANCCLFQRAQAQHDEVEHVFLITMDGLRWQELFGGAVDSFMMNPELSKGSKELMEEFHGDTPEEARKKLMPWFWSTMSAQGQIYGNRWAGNKVDCTNRFWFSYPGYSEILTGYSDPRIRTNNKENNPNITVLEHINNQPEFKGKVAAFGSWDVFPYIVNTERSGIPVNAGFLHAEGDDLTQKEIFLNELQDEIPSPWTSVRLDAFTHNYMMEYVKKHHPRLVYISYGETDDYAHDGRYDRYLRSAIQTDRFFEKLWNFIQSDPFYKDKTALVFTTDHGRGTSPMTEWKSHGTIYRGSHEIWAAAIGPGIEPLGEVKTPGQFYQNQIAKTVATLLGVDFKGDAYEAGAAITPMLPKSRR